MMTQETQRKSFTQTALMFLDEWFLFTLSDKLKFAIKVSLSLVLAYMIPLAMGWPQASTSAITIMLIASAGGVSESLTKGIIRIVGTLVGAVIGLTLIAIFPQERMVYLSVLSLVIALLIYLYFSYQGDSTVFMLSAMVTMMIFSNGPENAFIYGVDRTYMTLLGIVIYTVVGIFIWPLKQKENGPVDAAADTQKKPLFIWGDPEYLKGTVQLFLVFWATTAFWIYFNPPGGFLLVTLATLLGLFTTFSPLKPAVLMLLFSFGFIFATTMYIFVLPHLVYGWQLALFIFIYGFISFYFIKPKVTIFFLIGLFLLGIDNTMHYNFALFLNILLVFYMFLFVLILFRNIPFSARAEHLFLKIKTRFHTNLNAVVSLSGSDKKDWWRQKRLAYHVQHLHVNLHKMKLWGSKIDTNYFDANTGDEIMAFVKACEALSAQVLLSLEKEELSYNKQMLAYENAMKSIDWERLKDTRF